MILIHSKCYFKFYGYFLFGLFCLTISCSKDPNSVSIEDDLVYSFSWAKQMGGVLNDYGVSIALDQVGNIYTTGFFSGTSDFDPGNEVFEIEAQGTTNIFISKLDTSGKFIWAKNMGGGSGDIGRSIDVDDMANVYITGYFWNTADFDPGNEAYNLTSEGGADIFISKLDASGNFLWAKQLRGNLTEQAYSISLDGLNNVYVSGEFGGTVDFDPGGGIYNLTSVGLLDCFVVKLDESGNFLWANRMGGSLDDVCISMDVDAMGNAYILGDFEGTSDFDPGSSEYNLTSVGYDSSIVGNTDVFVSKLDPNGNFLWAGNLGGISQDKSHSISVDEYGNVFVFGEYSGIVDFDPGIGELLLGEQGLTNYITKLNSDGKYIWTKNLNMSGRIGSISTGSFDKGVVYQISNSETTRIGHLDESGNISWSLQMGGSAQKYGKSIAIDDIGNVFNLGVFSESTNISSDQSNFILVSAGGIDIYIRKLIPPSLKSK